MQKMLFAIILILIFALPAKSQGQYPDTSILHFQLMSEVSTENYEYAQGLIGQNLLLVRSADEGFEKDKLTNENFFDLYQWDQTQEQFIAFPDLINTTLHEGSACWSEGTQQLFFSRNQNTSNRGKNDRSGIYIWQNGSDTLSAFPYNKKGHILCHPSVAADGKLMVFAADFPGGYGGMDLYYSVKNEEGWTEPVNLGEAINTAGNEVFPFLHRSETLFYSSSGMDGQGGLDIFYSTPLSGVWQRPDALPVPFNSAGDDFAFWMNALGTKGFMNSNREKGTGNDDIYQFDSPRSLFIEGLTEHEIEVISEEDMRPVPGANVKLQFNQAWNAPFKKTITAVPEAEKPWQQSTFKTSDNGLVKFGIYEELWLQVIIEHPDYQKQTNIVKFDSDELWHQFVLRKKCLYQAGRILSENKRQPINGVKVELMNSEGRVIDSTMTGEDGNFRFCITKDESYSLTFTREGWESSNANNWSTNARRGSIWLLSELPEKNNVVLLPEGPFEKGSVFVFDQIYYDYNDSRIREDATSELDALIVKMKEQPGLRIELIAHTDSRGKNEYNLLLSVARAEAAKNYLVNNGIAGNRILAVGYGENELRNHCADDIECSEEEHAYNRRTEIKILSNE